MMGYPRYDEIGQIYGGDIDVCIYKKNGRYIYKEMRTIDDYSKSSDDDHCRGLWSSSKWVIFGLMKMMHINPGRGYSKVIEVEYDLDDPYLVLNHAGHLRSLKLKVHEFHPKWKYDIMQVGKSFIYN
jgi:hypothetical protein